MAITMARRWGFACGLVAFALGSCTAEQKITCGEGTELVAGKCIPLGVDAGATTTTDASTGFSCGTSTRVGDAGCEALRAIGSPCQSGAECSSGTCLSEARGAIDGYCTIAACSKNRPCPTGSRCHFSSAEESFLCLAYCDDDADCREGYACQPLYTSDASVCAPSCAKTDACPSGTQCNAKNGKCELHQCELGSSNACGGDADDDAGTASALVCYADRLGISASGALCLPACDPRKADEVCASNEVCQPLPEDPVTRGLCVPPLCSVTEDCSPGAVCMDGVCQPPARCDEDAKCTDKTQVCVGGAGGQCMPKCSKDTTCKGLHSALSCADAVGACLPTGSFPGGACRSDLASPCSTLSVRAKNGDQSNTPMICEAGVCLASCGQGGSTLCGNISSTLTCAPDVFDVPLCLPEGSFPGGPCDDAGACAPLAVAEASIPMACAREQCLVTCDAAVGGDIACAALDAGLVCIADAFGGATDVCLPRGTYPGGPCGPGNVCDTGMTCQGSQCLYQCSVGGQTLCNAVSPALSCATGVFAEPVCLPRGSFPGSPCRTSVGAECDQNLRGLPDADLACFGGTCLVQCQTLTIFASGEALCRTVNPALTCNVNPGTDFCAPAP